MWTKISTHHPEKGKKVIPVTKVNVTTSHRPEKGKN